MTLFGIGLCLFGFINGFFMLKKGKRELFGPFFWMIAAAFGCFGLAKDRVLYVSLGIILAMSTGLPVWGVRLWNRKEKRKPTFMITSLFIFFLMLAIFCITELEGFTFLRDFIGPPIFQTGQIRSISLFFKVLGMILLCVAASLYFTFVLFNFLDRFLSKKMEITLIQCKTMKMNGIFKWYYLEGVHNGKTYHFQTTREMYYILKNKYAMTVKARVGIFGGLYVLRPPVFPDMH